MLDLGKEYGRWEVQGGSVATWVMPPHVLVTRAAGHLPLPLAERIVQSGNAVIAQYAKLLAFHDWQEVRSYDSDARVRLTSWGTGIRANVERVHVLLGSKLVKMGVAVASMVLGNMIVAYDDRSEFEAAFRVAQSARGRAR